MSHESAQVPLPSVVFVHGLWVNGRETFWLRRRVRALGLAPVLFHYRSLSWNCGEVVERLSALLARLPPPVHLVGHSLGGVMVLRLFEHNPQQPPGRVVLMGAPVAGSRAARRLARRAGGRLLLGPLAREELLRSGPPHWRGARELGVIAGSGGIGLGRLVADLPEPNDGTVAVDETDLDGATDRVVLPVTHTGMLFSAQVAREVACFLHTGRFSGGSSGSPEGSDPS